MGMKIYTMAVGEDDDGAKGEEREENKTSSLKCANAIRGTS